VQKPGQWLKKRETRYWFESGNVLVWVEWRPYIGLSALGFYRVSAGTDGPLNMFPPTWRKKVKRRNVAGGASELSLPLPLASTVLKKFPRFLEFLGAAVYDDGSPRQLGRISLSGDMMAFTAILSDPDAFARVTIRGADFDSLLAAIELHLGAENAPWEVDRWAVDRTAKKGKKK
jgi:hypothetical protein